jgi:hypothetical protein
MHQYHIAHWNCGISQPQNPLEYGLWHDTLTHCLSFSSSQHIMEPIRSHTCTWNNYRRGNYVKMWTMCPILYTIKVSHKIMMDNIAMYNLANTPTCSCGINNINKVNITFQCFYRAKNHSSIMRPFLHCSFPFFYQLYFYIICVVDFDYEFWLNKFHKHIKKLDTHYANMQYLVVASMWSWI